MAAASPAELPPMMRASCRMGVVQVVGAATGIKAVEVGTQHGQRHFAEVREKEHIRVVERLVWRGGYICSTRQLCVSVRFLVARSEGQPSAV